MGVLEMTNEDVIQMARDACGPGAEDPLQDNEMLILSVNELTHFAELVAAKEREACANVAKWTPDSWGTNTKIAAAIRTRGEK